MVSVNEYTSENNKKRKNYKFYCNSYIDQFDPVYNKLIFYKMATNCFHSNNPLLQKANVILGNLYLKPDDIFKFLRQQSDYIKLVHCYEQVFLIFDK